MLPPVPINDLEQRSPRHRSGRRPNQAEWGDLRPRQDLQEPPHHAARVPVALPRIEMLDDQNPVGAEQPVPLVVLGREEELGRQHLVQGFQIDL